MKTLVLENWQVIDIPERLQDLLKKDKQHLGEIEYWPSFNQAFWPENRKATFERFSHLQTGDVIVAQTVFEDWIQLELMSELLLKLKDNRIHLNVLLVFSGLKNQIVEYFEEYESSITPQTDEYDNSPDLRKKFKQRMNVKVFDALRYHNLFEYYRGWDRKERVTFTLKELRAIVNKIEL